MNKIENFTTAETRFLSNFYPWKNPRGDKYPHIVFVHYAGLFFDCVEVAYQAAKAKYLEDMVQISEMDPFQAKKFADARAFIIRPDWDRVKLPVMKDLVRQKFYFSTALGKMLVGTGDAELLEGNSWGDTFWGICNGVGDNNLGKILMDVRERLRQKILR
ncbi:MAG: NADAR family protein [Rickettsiales bacterium]|jgi:ribA/ribD-fused uncharacterized protein|nr:NADAR family protein [Rickettsiales bacterium]